MVGEVNEAKIGSAIGGPTIRYSRRLMDAIVAIQTDDVDI